MCMRVRVSFAYARAVADENKCTVICICFETDYIITIYECMHACSGVCICVLYHANSNIVVDMCLLHFLASLV